jgi:beta-1,2-mannobiose phosphorylase / 1,2-beta-oligomannan phosphorylase
MDPSMTRDFVVEALDELEYECSDELEAMYKLSPFVWREGDGYHLLLRVVNFSDDPAEKVARIHYGRSRDGLRFVVGDRPVIAPDRDAGAYDNGGCEDPTVAFDGGRYFVYYSGWNERVKRGELLLASGSSIDRLEKLGIALESSEAARNPKEAEIVRVADGTWRLFFEYAHEDRSKIGIAHSRQVNGPWEIYTPLFAARPESWDNWHLSPGPVLGQCTEHPMMFYNGATRDAHWRIGWVVFDPLYTRVVARSQDPIIKPWDAMRAPEDTDIAFAASAVSDNGRIDLYYSIADRYTVRATIRAA